MKILKIIFLTVVFTTPILLLNCLHIYAGMSRSKSYKVSVTIPHIIGLNTNVQETLQAKKNNSSQQKIQFQKIVRNNKTIMLQTIVIK
ncbi:hypothetical protein MNBD_UNCLBAC01-332 [hydrothermal vent metagenome]|uniref:Uncharacterized protein n=1 Tax=hydrothermal vent metagenome TaxID=652676 RepID=A0A3B1DGA9_9ZZZZ